MLGSARRIEYGAVHHLVPRPVRAPQPVHIRLAPERDGKKRIYITEIFGLYRLTYRGVAVPARCSFRIPQRARTQCTQKVEPEARSVNIRRDIIMIKLRDVESREHMSVIHRAERHCVRSDGNRYVFMQYFALHVYKFDVAFVLIRTPQRAVMRIYPRVHGQRNIVKRIVPLAEQIEIPRIV